MEKPWINCANGDEMKNTKVTLEYMLAIQEQYWCSRARINWMKWGDLIQNIFPTMHLKGSKRT